MIFKALLVSVGLWIGTFIYCFFEHPNMLVVDVLDRCWFQFVGAMALGLVEDFGRKVKEKGEPCN